MQYRIVFVADAGKGPEPLRQQFEATLNAFAGEYRYVGTVTVSGGLFLVLERSRAYVAPPAGSG